MRARPMPMHKGHLSGIGLVEGAGINDQHATCARDERGNRGPERGGIGFEAMQQARKGIMRRGIGHARLDTRRFHATDAARRGDEEVDVIGGGTACYIHAPTLPPRPLLPQLRKP